MLYIGIDWGENQHDVVFMNEAGNELMHLTIDHTSAGFQEMDEARQRFGVPVEACWVGLETGHNLLIDFLWARGYPEIYVIPPRVVKSSRGRLSVSEARSDRRDALLLADLLRTDRGRLQPWRPGSLLYRRIRAQVSLYHHLSRSVIRWSNRLRSVLLRYYPAALKVFSHLTTYISQAFICAYPTPQAAAELTYAEFEAFACSRGYPHPSRLPECFARLQGPYPQADPGTVAVYQEEAVLLATLLGKMVRARDKAKRKLQQLFWQHPDAPIFDSLPGAGELLAPGLLAKFGEDRERFPSPASVQALAGTCPVTRRSGKRKEVRFRQACDREFRHIAQQWAKNSLRESPWAKAYWKRVRPHCASDSHAYRCLANRWLAIAWKLWQTHQLYDETYHLQRWMARSRPRR